MVWLVTCYRSARCRTERRNTEGAWSCWFRDTFAIHVSVDAVRANARPYASRRTLNRMRATCEGDDVTCLCQAIMQNANGTAFQLVPLAAIADDHN